MLGKSAFYYNSIKKYIVAFGMLFNDIHVIRTNKEGQTVKDIKVPITFTSKDKMAYQINSIHSRPVSEFPLGSIIPRLSYTITEMEFDGNRVLNALNIRKNINEKIYTTDSIGVGNPYNFNFQLSVWTKYLDDLYQIIEQVVTFFHPDYHVTIKEIPDLGIETSIPIVLESTNFDLTTEYGEEGYRIVRAEMNFVLKGWLYPPIQLSSNITDIKFRINDSETNNNIVTIRTDYDSEINKYYETILENIDPLYSEKVDAEPMEMRTVSQVSLNVYESETEPVLSEDEYQAFWFDTKNHKKYLITRKDGKQHKTKAE